MNVVSKPKAIRLYHLPTLVLFPSSLLFLTMNQMLVNTTDGRNGLEFLDVWIRWGMSNGLVPFMFCFALGSGLLAVALFGWLYEWQKTRQVNWSGLAWIGLGILAHPWVMGPVWDFFLERMKMI